MPGNPDLVKLASEIAGCCENVAVRKHRAKMLGEKSMQLVNLLQEEPLSLGATTQTWFDESSSLLRGILKHIQRWSSWGSVVQWLGLVFLKREIERHNQDLDTVIRLIRSNTISSPDIRIKEDKTSMDWVLNTLTSVLSTPEKENALQELKGDHAQILIDFMYTALSGRVGDGLTPQQRKQILTTLRRLSETSTLYPHWFPLQGMAHQPYEGASGEFYDIRRGNYKGVDLSLRVLRVLQPDQVNKMFKIYAREMILWSQLRHANIVFLYGVHYLDETRRHVSLVSPWVDSETLPEYLERNPTISRTSLIHDIINGLSYLHDNNVVHGDLRAANILVDGSGKARLTDFGLSAIWADKALTFASMTNTPFDRSIRWTAPELLEVGKVPNQASDIWAFGGVCYEILTGRVPFYECTNDYQIVQRLLEGRRPGQPDSDFDPNNVPDKVGDEMWELMNCCWSYKPAERPTGQAILQLLEPRIIEGVGPADEVESVTQGSHYPQLPIGKDLVNSLDLFQVRKILASL